ncbi:ASAT1 [Scenedesmus sp. PABB004]|nr:ASAT1 [Scenedesmus sp. PABB004]
MQAALDLADGLRGSLPFAARAQLYVAAVVGGGLAIHLCLRRAAPGGRALALAAPLVALNAWLPLLFAQHEEVLSRCVALLLSMWLGSFKAVGLALGRGPLVGDWNAAQTVLLYAMPIYPSAEDAGVRKGRLGDAHGTAGQALRSFAVNTVMLVTMATTLATFDLPLLLKYYIYGLGLYGFITFLMDGCAAPLIGLADMQVVPPFDKPWMSVSLADFWTRRWNNTVSLTLRALVYDPLVEGRLMAAPPPAGAAPQQQHHHHHRGGGRVPLPRRVAGLAATFAVSGVMHELVLAYLTLPGDYHPWHWLAFFLVQAPALAAEGAALAALRARGGAVPRPLGIAYTTAFVLATSAAFWFPPICDRSGLAEHIVASVTGNVAGLAAAARRLAAAAGLAPGASAIAPLLAAASATA